MTLWIPCFSLSSGSFVSFFFFVITSYCSFGLDAGSWSSIYLKLKSELSRGFDTVGSCFMHETPFVYHLVFIEYFDGSFGNC